jgi:Domain of unknown function (DUF6894)
MADSMRLFFHLFDGAEVILDHEGVEVADLQEAQSAITYDVNELKREFPIEDRSGWRLNVADRAGVVLFSIPLDGAAE